MKYGQIVQDGVARAIVHNKGQWLQFEQTLDELLQAGNFPLEEAIPIEAPTETSFCRPMSNVQRVLCVGLNFTDHAAEVGAELPTHPTIFTKFGNALIGPGDPIQLPLESSKIDWEVELCAVIGKPGRRVRVEEAEEHILGYTVLNDVSVRDWQGRTSEWFQGKNWDCTTPFGPVIVSPDELDIAAGLAMRCSVDGAVRQQGSTANLIFSPAEVVSYISTFMTLQPGDLIALGTPAGVGLSLRPRQWLAAGQAVVTEIEGIGSLTNVCAEPA
ncbi:MAG: fumarylacetoacetate hydrolase family protein [Rothia sp. (in: high G+C Gram-positive bacteria)]|nr:fumarylacetoacetate hydrolase family protein [Rothia sp. (in: high G+C Gram-positive bacteria)]